jgi:hypothetical protein
LGTWPLCVVAGVVQLAGLVREAKVPHVAEHVDGVAAVAASRHVVERRTAMAQPNDDTLSLRVIVCAGATPTLADLAGTAAPQP